jgi:hypothetical protein
MPEPTREMVLAIADEWQVGRMAKHLGYGVNRLARPKTFKSLPRAVLPRVVGSDRLERRPRITTMFSRVPIPGEEMGRSRQ